MDGVRASGNRDVCVKTTPTKRGIIILDRNDFSEDYLFGLKLKMYLLCSGYRWGPLYCAVDEEVESSHLKFLATPPGNA